MKKIIFTPTLLVIAALLTACNSMPTSTSMLDQTRNDYQSAQSNPKVASYAPLEMKQASDAMAKANAASANNDSTEDIDKLAYLAKQKIALTQEVAKQKSAEADVAKSGTERDKMRLDQRTREADQSRTAANIARGDAAYAQQQTRDAQARNANLEAQLAELSAKKTERGMVITLGDVLFATDQARLNPEGQRTVQKLAQVLTQNPQRTVLIEGFTDSTGSSAHNQALSERRADSVQLGLLEQGIARNRIAIHGYGEAHPVAGNESTADRQLNRRVEIVLSEDDGKIRPR
ncbi:MAG: OmpA family protein [Betaproteobacteria bacterium]|nr:OmpA family protein [Betaproteobacteria bacterium]